MSTVKYIDESYKQYDVLDYCDLVLLKAYIARCGDLACAAAEAEIPISAIRRTCDLDQSFKFALQNALGKFHYKIRARINDLAHRDRQKLVPDGTGRMQVEFIPNEKMVQLASTLYLEDLKNNKDLDASLQESDEEQKEIQHTASVQFNKLSAATRKELLQLASLSDDK